MNTRKTTWRTARKTTWRTAVSAAAIAASAAIPTTVNAGAMSDRMGMRGFEWGFALMGGAYVVGATAMLAAMLFTFNKDRINEN